MYYRYNSQNRMVQAERKIGAVLDITQYSYTADGIRRSQVLKAGTVDAREIRYLIDPNQAYAQVIEERVGAPLAAGANVSGLSLKTAYTYGDDLLGQYALRDAAGNVLPGAATSAISSTFHYDGLGSTRLLTDNAGNPIDSYAYGAFGDSDHSASALAIENIPATDYQYTGEQHDQNLGWYYLRARHMSPTNGRFSQMDAFQGANSNPITLNKYVYGNSDATNWRDPSGYVGLTDQAMASNISASLTNVVRTGSGILNIYQRMQTAVDFLNLANQIARVAQTGQISSTLTSASGFPSHINKYDAVEKFLWNGLRAVSVGAMNWASGYIRSSNNNSLKSFLLYMPNPLPGTGTLR